MQTNNEKKPVDKKNINYQRDKEREKVKGIFKFYEVPGGQLSFIFKKYKGDPVEKYTLVDGRQYEIPLGVAKHLNTSGKYPVHKYMQDEDGKPAKRIGQMVARYGFQSLEFLDSSDWEADESSIIQIVEAK